MCFSTSYLLSKCGMPVCRLAEPTDVKTRCTPAALAASAAATPCRVSASVPPPNGVVIAKREVAPSSALAIAAVSSSDAATSVAPACASDLAWLELWSRVTARTSWPRSRRPRATAPPCLPVDPVTTTVSSCAMFWFLSPAVIFHQMPCGQPRARGTMCPMQGTIEAGAVELFVRVAELRSFRGAADALGVPRSTVSRRISELERALGTRLLQRTTRRVELTSAGKTYLRACGPALGTILEAGRALSTSSEETAGRLRVTAPVTLGEGLLGDGLTVRKARHPQMSIELVLTDRQVELVEEKFDLAFRSGTLKDTSLVAHELGRAQPRCFAAREYLRDRGTPRTPRDLLRHDCVLFTPLAPRGRWTFRSRGRTVEVPVRGRLVVNSIPLALDGAMRGLGIVRVPGALVVEGLAAKQLVEVLDAYAPPPRPAYAVHPSGGRVTPAARVFLEIAKRHLERRVW